MNNQEIIGVVLLFIAFVGFVYKCIVFVRVTVPENYGLNPGFGCFETMVMPWFVIGCVGMGLFLHSWTLSLVVFIAGLFVLGFLAMLLSRLFK